MRHPAACFLIPGLLLSIPAAAQGVRAGNNVIVGCTAKAPERSALPRLATPPSGAPDANGLYALEVEWAGAGNGWVHETQHAGFTGSGYFRWTGGNLFSTPGRGVLRFGVDVPRAMKYRIALHNRHEHSDPSLDNDCWIRVNGSGWTKLYSNDGRNSRVWTWHSRLDPGHGYVDYDMRAGTNVIELSGRSQNFMIDRMHVYPTNHSAPFNTSIPANRAWMRPVLGSDYGVRLGDPRGQTNLIPGVTRAALMVTHRGHRNSPCGMLLPGFGPKGGPGEFLLAETPVPIVLPVAPAWKGPTEPATIDLPIPNVPALAGSRVLTQGLLFDGRSFVLTDRLDLRLGDH